MAPALALVLEVLTNPASLTALGAFFGAKKFYEDNKDDIPSLFGSSDEKIIPVDMQWSDDTTSTIPTDSKIPVNLEKTEDEIEKDLLSQNVFDDYVIRRLETSLNSEDIETSENIDLSDLFDTDTIELPQVAGGNLLDTLKGNTEKITTVLTALNNTFIGGISVLSVLPLALKEVSNNIKQLNQSVLLSNVSLLGISQSIKSLQLKVDTSSITEAIKQIDLSTINEKISIVAEAKKLEKENYEYMKTPQTYKLSDEALPNIAPRDVIALSEAVKAYLNSQEASLTAEDLGLEEYDNAFDVDNILKLFEFKGISEDINKLPKE